MYECINMGYCLDLMILEYFSNFNEPMIFLFFSNFMIL